MHTTPEQLQQWLAEPEGTRLEFKEAKSRYEFEKLLQCCATSKSSVRRRETSSDTTSTLPPRMRKCPGR